MVKPSNFETCRKVRIAINCTNFLAIQQINGHSELIVGISSADIEKEPASRFDPVHYAVRKPFGQSVFYLIEGELNFLLGNFGLLRG